MHFVVLDSQEVEERDLPGDNGSILNTEKAWLEKDLSSTTKEWKVVLFHKTPYYNKAIRANDNLKAALTPIFDKYHVDFVFNGHDHGISRTFPMNNDKAVDAPSKGTVYYVTGRSGNKYYKDLSQKAWDAFFYDPQDQPNYIVAQVNGDKLTISAFKQDGTPIDTYSVDKSTDTDSPKTVVPGKYNYTRLQIYGNLMQTPFLPAPPKQINGKWYVPARAFTQFLGGNVGWNDGKVTLSITQLSGDVITASVSIDSTSAKVGKNDVTIPDAITLDSNMTWISADDLNTLFGYTWNFDDSTNVLSFSKDGGE